MSDYRANPTNFCDGVNGKSCDYPLAGDGGGLCCTCAWDFERAQEDVA